MTTPSELTVLAPQDDVGIPDYPLTLRVTGRLCVVVGAGPVGARRARALLAAGAHVRVVAPKACAEIAAAAASGDVALTWEAREYLTGDLDGAWLVHTATGNADVDALVASDAQWQRVWCVRASHARSSSAWVPAVARVDDVVVTVNAGGDPRRATRLRDAIVTALRGGLLPMRRFRRAPRPEAGEAPASAPGSVALLGGGPGALDLLTVRARKLILEADVVIIDRLAPREILTELPPEVTVIDVGKAAGDHPVPQEEINSLLVEHAAAGHNVVRLKGGDPYVFGRGGEELDACRAAGLDVQVVPGVTSAISVPAAAGIPVTHRGVSRGFTVLTAHDDVGSVSAPQAAGSHTLILLMGLARLARTCAELIDSGHDPHTPVAVIEDGFGPRQRSTLGTLTTIADRVRAAGVRAPAVTVIGDVVRRAPDWPGQEPA